MLLAGTDVSGNTEKGGQAMHISFVIGTDQSINSLHNDIGIKNIHMDELDEAQRQQVYRKLVFTRNDIQAWCFRVERQNTIDFIYKNEKLNRKNRLKSKVQRHFDYLLFRLMREQLISFIYPRGGQLTSLTVECDGDMSKTIDNWKMKSKHKGKAYQLADAVAWCNNKNRRIKQCGEPDYVQNLREQMMYDLFKR